MTRFNVFPLSTIEMFLFVCLFIFKSPYIVHSLKKQTNKNNPKANFFFELRKTSCFILAGQSKWTVFRPRCKMTHPCSIRLFIVFFKYYCHYHIASTESLGILTFCTA